MSTLEERFAERQGRELQEEAVVGGLFTSPAIASRLCLMLSEGDFEVPEARLAFRLARQCLEAGLELAVPLVLSGCPPRERATLADWLGGAVSLGALLVQTPAGAETAGRSVGEAAFRRRLTRLTADPGLPLGQLLAELLHAAAAAARLLRPEGLWLPAALPTAPSTGATTAAPGRRARHTVSRRLTLLRALAETPAGAGSTSPWEAPGDLPRSTFYRLRKSLFEQGLIEGGEGGGYSLTAAGIAALAEASVPGPMVRTAAGNETTPGAAREGIPPC